MPAPQPLTLDRFDRAILDIVQRDGRISNQALAERIGLSPSPCLRRVKALEDNGLILGYRAVVDSRPLGYDLMALLHISMDLHTAERFDNFERQVRDIPAIVECLIITGQAADFQLKILVRDMDDYQHLLLHVINRIEGVTGAHTSFVLRRVFEHRPVPTQSTR
ncbi:Lrp/AsnC family transcriptional regulator [Salinicola aestuarinus]|uniref:Lrp/AsnC family transcriptional regulator n=1 Tax=Salinicola aestuarinus TaxID=1949082 RepID=UPI000DA20F3E|nr:Lrp/AsnC family transcriptional regulator [Salinicola aestuarinus]